MERIPVIATLSGAYRFLFGHIVSFIGTLWLPILVMIAFDIAVIWSVVPHAWFEGPIHFQIHDEAYFERFFSSQEFLQTVPQLGLGLLLMVVAKWIVSAMVTARLISHAVGLKQSTTWAYFSLAAPVWRVLASFLLFLLAIMLLAVALSVAAGLVTGAGMLLLPGSSGEACCVLDGVAGLAAVLVLIYVLLRLGFFNLVVAVAEERIGLGRAWELGRGNVLRMFLVWLGIVLPVKIVAAVVVLSIFLPVLIPLISGIHAGVSPEGLSDLLTAMAMRLPFLMISMIVLGLAYFGLMIGAIGSAYNAVTTNQAK